MNKLSFRTMASESVTDEFVSSTRCDLLAVTRFAYTSMSKVFLETVRERKRASVRLHS